MRVAVLLTDVSRYTVRHRQARCRRRRAPPPTRSQALRSGLAPGPPQPPSRSAPSLVRPLRLSGPAGSRSRLSPMPPMREARPISSAHPCTRQSGRQRTRPQRRCRLRQRRVYQPFSRRHRGRPHYAPVVFSLLLVLLLDFAHFFGVPWRAVSSIMRDVIVSCGTVSRVGVYIEINHCTEWPVRGVEICQSSCTARAVTKRFHTQPSYYLHRSCDCCSGA